jgi:hypothetical protein
MTAASSLAFPGSRTLAAWARQLAPHQPRALWVGHLFWHVVEAPVRAVRQEPLDPLYGWVLRAVAAEQRAPPASTPEPFLGRLDRRLHLGLPLLRQVLRALATEGLVKPGSLDRWQLSDLGSSALAHSAYPRVRQERRQFHFVAPGGGNQSAEVAPHFLHVNGVAGTPWPEGEQAGFDVKVLHSCIGQPGAWKEQHRFPEEVQEVVQATFGTPALGWEQVIVDRPERLPAALVLSGDEGQLLGFAVRQERWMLNADHPMFTLRGDWHGPLPDLAVAMTEENCRRAWQDWCCSRELPAAEVNACRVQAENLHLRVTPPPALAERLRDSRAVKGETWLLAGEGALRAALQMQIET